MSRAFLHLRIRLENQVENATWEWDFYQTYGFNRIIKVIMLHNLDQKNLHINELIFFVKSTKPYFLRYFWALSPNWDFSSKIQLYQFLPLRHPNFMRSFKKILWAALEKKVYLLTYQHTDSGEIIGTVFVYRWESNNLATKTFLELLEFQESWNIIGQD